MRLLLAGVATVLGALAFTVAPALAAAPEKPETGVASAITATTATLEGGVLNPNAAGELGEYQFLYRVSESECEGESATPSEPAAGSEKEAVAPVSLTNLQPNAKYTFCLIERNLAAESSPASTPVTFKTSPAVPAVEGESVSAVTGGSVTLDGVVNANNQEVTKCEFQYGTSATLAGSTAVGCEPGTLLGVYGSQPVERMDVSGLKPDTTYYYRVVAENATGVGKGSIASFQTTPEKPETGKVKAGSITATSVEMEGGVLDPKAAGEGGEYQYVYRVSATECEGEAASPAGAASGVLKEAVPAEKLESLQPNATYTVCLLERDSGGASPASTPVTFKTLAAPPAIESITASDIKAASVTLEGVVNPNNEPTECHIQWGTASVSENELPCSPELLSGTFGGQGVSSTKLNEKNEVTQSITGLTAATTYKYRILAKNGAGQETNENTFTTNARPETPETTEANPVSGTTATFNGVLNPAGHGEPGTYEFLYKQSPNECELSPSELKQSEEEENRYGHGPEGKARVKVKQKATPSPAGTASSGIATPVSASVSGLLPGAEYTVCLRATSTLGETATSVPVTFTTSVIGGEDSPTVTATEATVSAEIGTDNGETSYHVQYGTNSAEETATPEATIAASSTPVTAEVRLAGLKAATTYHFHFIANNGHGQVQGEKRTFTTPPTPGTEPPENCPNAARRAEQPYAKSLPDCRAYEQVSPTETSGQDATDAFANTLTRAAASGEAITYSSRGSYADPVGAVYESQILSERGPNGWTTRSITPSHKAINTETNTSYQAMVFTPDLSEGVARSDVPLTGEAPPEGQPEQYVADFADDTYQWISTPLVAETPYEYAKYSSVLGASTDLTHIVFVVEPAGALYEWISGEAKPVGVANNGEVLQGNVGRGGVSADGSRVLFTSDGQMYVRENVVGLQSPLAFPVAHGTGELTSGAAGGTGDLASGSSTVSSVVTAAGDATLTSGSSEVTSVTTSTGEFFAGQPISGTGIPAEVKITKVTGSTLTLSAPITASGTHVPISTDGPAPFVVGQEITGSGIPSGTTITAAAPGTLTLSTAATASASNVALSAGGECTVPADACTVDASASRRSVPDPNGPVQTSRYQAASVDGSRVFFTSDAELTENAYTGPADNGANLYEYNLADGELTDLTVDTSDVEGAAVQGVEQVSEDGAYVYFVANGDLGGNATAGQPNLYVSHEGGAPAFIATLGRGDGHDWTPGTENNGAEVTPSGSRLAFMSEQSLTGYDNEQAAAGDCEGEVEGYNTYLETGRCQEIYLYNAGTGELECASCNPSGARPIGPSSFGPSGNRGTAATPEGPRSSTYRPRNLVEGGALFFNSHDALVPHASDSQVNVYEYEDGHVHAISDVAGGSESFFLDASATGGDVFFATATNLLGQETNRVAVYDARVDGGLPVSVSPPACDNGDSCKPPPTPQPAAFGAPGSATFSGPGNPVPAVALPTPAVVKPKAKVVKCKKEFVKNKKDKCVKSKKKKAKAKKSDIASNDRRATR